MYVLNGNHHSKEVLFGARVEAWALEQLQARGYTAKSLGRWTDRYDILVSDNVPLLIEVKGAHASTHYIRPGYIRPRWQFKMGGRPKIDHVIILVCVDDAGKYHPFICPSWLFFGRANVAITSHPLAYAQRGRGMFAPYLNQWTVLDEVATQRQHILQLPLLELYTAGGNNGSTIDAV